MKLGIFVKSMFLLYFLILTMHFGFKSGFGQQLGLTCVCFKGWSLLQDFILATRRVRQITGEQQKWRGTYCGMVKLMAGRYLSQSKELSWIYGETYSLILLLKFCTWACTGDALVLS